MSKILYIEDELTKNIPAIKKMFEPLLANRYLMKQLDALESKKPVLASDVVNVCNKASELDVVYKFPVALTKAVHHHQDYDLIIIDRDLSGYDYSAAGDKIKSDLEYAGLSDPGEKVSEYKGHEGDLLLLILLRLEPDSKDKIYFLADKADEIVRNSPELDTIMDITHFSADRILEKSTEAEKVISEVVADLPAFSIQNQYRAQCEILRKRFSEDNVDLFIDIVRLSYDIEKKIDFMQKLRPMTERFLVTLAEQVNDRKATYWDNYRGKTSLKQKDFINSLDGIDRRISIGYNKNIRQCLYSLWQIPSDFASHISGNPDDITNYTIQALLNQLCDVILWYEKAIGNLETGK